MKVKTVLYATVGAPVVAVRKVSDKTSEVYDKINERATGYGESAGKTIDTWAAEGEKVVVRVKEGEITSKVDLDQAKEQVGKLRDQLEDMLDTWRHSFRPEKAASEGKPSEEKEAEAPEKKAPAEAGAKKAEPKKTAAKPAAAKAAAAKAAPAEAGGKKAAPAKAGSKTTETKASAAKTTKSAAAEKSSEETVPAEAEKAS